MADAVDSTARSGSEGGNAAGFPPDALPTDAPAPRESAPHEPLDWAYTRSFAEGPLDDIINHYFRATVLGADRLPDPGDGPCIVAPNHSGNAFPHDAIVLDGKLWEMEGRTKAAKFRSVYTPQLAATWWMRPFAIPNWWRRVGGVDMTFDNFDALLARGDRVIYYPEGVPGIGKGFLRRYQLQPFHSSFVVLAARHDAPVYPVSAVNAEWVNPTSLTFESLNRLFQKLIGIPFLPLPIAPLAFVLPFVFYLGFPCKMTFQVQEPVDVRAMLRAEGADPADPGREAATRVAERIRQQAQSDLDAAVDAHGSAPYDVSGLVDALKDAAGSAVGTTPLGWPVRYLKHARNHDDGAPESRWKAWLRDWDLAAWYLPFGWFLVALIRRFRKPPYGVRGLSDDEAQAQEGNFRWHLQERPLPSRDTLQET